MSPSRRTAGMGVLVAVVAVAAVSPGRARAQADRRPSIDRAVLLLEPISEQGANSRVSMAMRIGERANMFLNLFEADGCIITGSGGHALDAPTLSDWPALRPQRWWTVTATLRAVTLDQVTADIEWRHLELRNDALVFVRGDKRTMTLDPQRPLLLDALRADEIAAACNPGVYSVALFGMPQPSPTRDREWVRHEVWLEHRGPDGTVRRHLRDERRHGGEVAFDFAPIRQRAIRDGCELELNVHGSLRTVVREDGDLDVLAVYGRTAGLAPRRARAGLLSGASFRHESTVRSGDVIRFVLPVPPGENRLATGTGACGGLAGQISEQEAFGSSETAVIVRITRLGPNG